MSDHRSKVDLGIASQVLTGHVAIFAQGQGIMSVKHFEEFEPERLVKSSERVRDLGEVFTPALIVDDMLDLFPDHLWEVHPASTFLEPSVGNGNFVSAILSRKLTLVDEALHQGKLPAGMGQEAAEFHALEALSSIYGVDISEENIIGGTPGHEIACRPRLLNILLRWHRQIFGNAQAEHSYFFRTAHWIVDHNMIIGNMLEKDGDGKLTGRDEMPIVEYTWNPIEKSVSVARTTFGDISLAAEEERGDVLTLFGATPPVALWAGPFDQLFSAERDARIGLDGSVATNSRGKR